MDNKNVFKSSNEFKNIKIDTLISNIPQNSKHIITENVWREPIPPNLIKKDRASSRLSNIELNKINNKHINNNNLIKNENENENKNKTIIVPPAATGLKAENLYKECIEFVKIKGSDLHHKEEERIELFKTNCRQYGLNNITLYEFYEGLLTDLGDINTFEVIPKLIQLIPSEEKRKELMEYNEQYKNKIKNKKNNKFIKSNNIDQSCMLFPTEIKNDNNSTNVKEKSDNHISNVKEIPEINNNKESKSIMSRSSSSTFNSGNKSNIFNGRYGDHPLCDICKTTFEVTRRRHQCRHCGSFVCSSCSPLKLLIPPGKEISNPYNTKHIYVPSEPQRVCIQCAPKLHSCQVELQQKYGNFRQENVHEAKGRFHIPYTSSLEIECRNAADIIGNFFRSEWGSSTDRRIPATLLAKAHGIAIMTVAKAGFLVTGKIGTGLVVARLPDNTWSPPCAIGTFGLGGGFEIGGEIVEIMIILGSVGAVKVFHKSQVNIGAGLDLAIGPYGRSAEIAASASQTGLNSNYSYSMSKGLYAGISLQGAVITTRNDINSKFYGRDIEPKDILTQEKINEKPKAAKPLYDAIEKAMLGIQEIKEIEARRIQLIGSCKTCHCNYFSPHTTQVWNKKCKNCKHVH